MDWRGGREAGRSGEEDWLQPNERASDAALIGETVEVGIYELVRVAKVKAHVEVV